MRIRVNSQNENVCRYHDLTWSPTQKSNGVYSFSTNT